MATIVSQSISDVDMNILRYQIYDPSNETNPADLWINGALVGKVNNAYKNMKTVWVPKLMDDASVAAISASKDEFVGQVMSHPDYKTRYQNEATGSLIE